MVNILDSFPLDYKVLLMGNIKDKIVGNARRSLLINGHPEVWPEIKKVLTENHGEKNSVNELIDKIRSCRCDSTIENFYIKLNNLLCRLNNALYFSDNQIPGITSEGNGRIALNSFKYGLPEPVRSIIVSRNPKNLKEAYDIIKSNGYLKFSNNEYPPQANTRNIFRSVNSQSNNSNVNRQYSNNNSYRRFNNNNRTWQNYNNNTDTQFCHNNNIDERYNNNNNGQSYNNNFDGHYYYNNTNGQGFNNNNNTQRYNNTNTFQNSQPQHSTQSRQRYNNSDQTRKQQHNPFLSNSLSSNQNPKTSVEPMELGVNESCQNFQYRGEENYPI